MPLTYTTNTGITKIGTGEEAGSWGTIVNTNMDITDRAINGVLSLSLSGTTSTLNTSDGTLSDGQYRVLVLGGSPSGTHTITISPNDAQKLYFVKNGSGQSVVFTQGSGGNATIADGKSAIVYANGGGAGAAVVDLTSTFNFQPLDAALTSISGLTTAANKMIYTTASDTYAVTDLTAAGRDLLDDADAAAQRTTLGLVIGTDVQAYDAALASIAGLTTAADKMIYTTASDTYAVTDLTSAGRDLLDDADAAAQRTTLGLVIGTDVQAYDADLAAVAGLSTTGIMVRTGAGTAATRTLTAGNGIGITSADGVSGNITIASDMFQTMHVVEEIAASAVSGDATSGSYFTRALNTSVTNTITGASLASNQITLPAGTYNIFAQVPGYRVDGHIAKFRRVSASAADVVIGTVGYTGSGTNNGNSYSYIFGQFTVATSGAYEVQQRVDTTRASDGQGAPAATLWEAKRLTQVFIQKVND